MKFLLIVLIIRFLAGVMTKKKNKSDQNNVGIMNKDILHPAEFDMR